MAKDKKTEKDKWLEQWRKEHNKSVEYAKVEYFVKAIEEYVEKCAVTLKGIKGAIAPILRQYTITAIEGVTPDYENMADYEFFLDGIAKFYRDNYNSKEPKALWMEGGTGGYAVRMYLKYDPNDTAMPTLKEFQNIGDGGNAPFRETGAYSNDFFVKMDNKGMTITQRDANTTANTNSFGFNGPIQQNNSNMLNWMWDDKYENGADQLWQDQKAGKIDYNGLNDGLKKIVNSYQQDNMQSSTKYLKDSFSRNSVPMNIDYVEIPRTY